MKPKTQSLIGLLRWGIILLLFLTTLLVFISLVMLAQLDNNSNWQDHSKKVQLVLSQLRSDLATMESQERGYWLTENRDFLGNHDEVADRLSKIAAGELPDLVQDNANQSALAQQLKAKAEERLTLSKSMIYKMDQGKIAEVRQKVLSGEPRQIITDMGQLMTQMELTEQSLLTKRTVSMDSTKKGLGYVLILGLLLDLSVGLVILYRLTRRLEPLSECAAMADRIGKGDLSLQPLAVRVEDEVGVLTRRLNEMLENLRLLTVQNRGAAEKLGTATRTILSASRDQAVYVQQQAAAVQETSATMEELGQSANHISERARDVVARAEATSKASEQGLHAVEENVRSTASTLEQVRVVASKILSLSEKTQAIGDIVSTVNDLSERSNVLALNAAILAAASPEGKTFSVVANEMKSLAEQSKDATTQVRGLLGDIERGIQACVFLTEEAVKRGEAGSVYTDQVNASIQNLAGSIQESLSAFQQIVAATDQQRTASDHVNSALWSIRQASDQTAMGTQKFEASARELHELSQALVATMERYRLRHETS